MSIPLDSRRMGFDRSTLGRVLYFVRRLIRPAVAHSPEEGLFVPHRINEKM